MNKIAFALAACIVATSAFAAPPEVKLPDGWTVEEGDPNFEAQYQPPKIGMTYEFGGSRGSYSVIVTAANGFDVSMSTSANQGCKPYAMIIPCAPQGFYSSYKNEEIEAGWPMKIGKTWSYIRNGNSGWTAQTKVKVVASKVVTTPFGKFNAFEMEYDNPGLFNNRESGEGRMLYAPAIGMNLTENFYVTMGQRSGSRYDNILTGISGN